MPYTERQTVYLLKFYRKQSKPPWESPFLVNILKQMNEQSEYAYKPIVLKHDIKQFINHKMPILQKAKISV